MSALARLILKLVFLILLFSIFTGISIYSIINWPLIASPIVLVILLSFYLWKNRSIELAEIPPREYYSVPNNLDLNKTQFKVMSYNVMANNVTSKLIYQNASFPILNFFKYRGPRIIKEIEASLPSIICMQEIDEYNKFYKPQLEALGYDTFLNKREKLFRHGALVGFLKSKWLVEKVENINYNHASENKKYKQHAAAIMAIAKSLETGKKILVCSVHTYFMGNSTKFLEVAYTTHRIQKFLQETNNQNIPVIMAGDFNAPQNSIIIQYLFGKQPQFNVNGEEYQEIYNQYPYCIQDWKFKNSYDDYPEYLPKPYTHFLPSHQGILDYIFYSSNNLKLTQLLQPPAINYLKENEGAPNKYQSSDHIRIEAEFQFE